MSKIDFDNLNDSDKISYRSATSNRTIARCTIGALIISIATLLITLREIKQSNKDMKAIIESLKITSEAAAKSSLMAEKSSIIAENALNQSEKQFIESNKVILEYSEVHSNILSDSSINVTFHKHGNNFIKLNEIKYSIQFVPRKDISKFTTIKNEVAFNEYNISGLELYDLNNLESEGISFPIKNTNSIQEIYWNNGAKGKVGDDKVFLLSAIIYYTNLTTYISYKYKIALYCEFSWKNESNKCNIIFKKSFNN